MAVWYNCLMSLPDQRTLPYPNTLFVDNLAENAVENRLLQRVYAVEHLSGGHQGLLGVFSRLVGVEVAYWPEEEQDVLTMATGRIRAGLESDLAVDLIRSDAGNLPRNSEHEAAKAGRLVLAWDVMEYQIRSLRE